MYSKNSSVSPENRAKNAKIIFVMNSTTFVIAAMIGAAAFMTPFTIAMIRVRINSNIGCRAVISF